MSRIETFRERTEGFSTSEKALVYGFSLIAVLLAGLLLAPPKPAHAETIFTVNRTGDAEDANLANAACDVNASVSGNQCTLRAAIQEANDTPGADTIRFNIDSTASVKTISPNSSLPVITEAVTINGYSQPGASPNTLATGNDAVLKIEIDGTNAGEEAYGLRIIEASDSTIRGLVINRFDGPGILISGSSATGNEVKGNFIGTDAAGSTDLGNSESGVFVANAPNNTIGGTAAAARNIISGNQTGVFISGPDAMGNKVEGNFIGTDASGTEDLGNTFNGVEIRRAPNNTIGGTAAGARNLISGNEAEGVRIRDSEAKGNKVEGNAIRNNTENGVFIGLDTENGVFIYLDAADNTIRGNLIFANGAAGVRVESGSVGNSVLSNQIFGNGGLGIDLGHDGSVTNNDTDDPDTGANNLQNFPVITSAIRSNTSWLTTIYGKLNSNPSQEFTVQCFLVTDNDPSRHGEGFSLLMEDTTVTTDANGDARFSCATGGLAVGQVVSVTATNETTGDTSVFSRNVAVVAGP